MILHSLQIYTGGAWTDFWSLALATRRLQTREISVVELKTTAGRLLCTCIDGRYANNEVATTDYYFTIYLVVDRLVSVFDLLDFTGI